MSNFAYVRPLGVWNVLTDLHAAEMAQIDQNLFKTANFADGSTHAPSGVVTVGGAGMTLKLVGVNTLPNGGFLDIDGALNVSGFSYLSGSHQYSGQHNYNGSLGSGCASFYYNGATADFTGATLSIGSGGNLNVKSGGSLTVLAGAAGCLFESAVGFTAHVNITSAGLFGVDCGSTFTGAVTLNGPTIIAGSASLTSVIVTSGVGQFHGRSVHRVINAAGAAGQTASPLTASLYYFPSAASGSTIQIDDTGAVDGDQIQFVNYDPTNLVIVKNPGGSSLFSIRKAGGDYFTCACTRLGGVWLLTAYNIS